MFDHPPPRNEQEVKKTFQSLPSLTLLAGSLLGL